MKKITLFFILLSSLSAQDNCSTKMEYYNCRYYPNDLYLSALLSLNNPSQAEADAVLRLYGTLRCHSRIVTMTLEEKENCKNQNESERLRNRWKNNNEAWEKDNQRTATEEEEKVLQEKIDVEAAQDMLINKETYDTAYEKNGRRIEDKRYDSDGEYIGRYHYQYYGDAFGTERDSKDKNEIRTGRVLWWYPSGYLESESFFENGKYISKKCFADNSSNEEISCPWNLGDLLIRKQGYNGSPFFCIFGTQKIR